MLKVELAPGGARKVKKQNKNGFFSGFFFRKSGVFWTKSKHFWKFCFGYCLQNFRGDFQKKQFLFFRFFTFFENPLIIVLFWQEFWRFLRFGLIYQRSFTKSQKTKKLIYDTQRTQKLAFRTLFSLFSKKVFQNDQTDKKPFKNTHFFLEKVGISVILPALSKNLQNP